MPAEYVVAHDVKVGGKTNGHRHIGHRILQNQVPADDPGKDLAQGRISVGVGAARYWNHRSQLGVTERRETARNGHQDERERDAWPGAWPPNGRDRVRAVQDQVKNRGVHHRVVIVGLPGGGRSGERKDARTNDGPDSKRDQTSWTKRAFQLLVVPLGGLDKSFNALGLKQLGHSVDSPWRGLDRPSIARTLFSALNWANDYLMAVAVTSTCILRLEAKSSEEKTAMGRPKGTTTLEPHRFVLSTGYPAVAALRSHPRRC